MNQHNYISHDAVGVRLSSSVFSSRYMTAIISVSFVLTVSRPFPQASSAAAAAVAQFQFQQVHKKKEKSLNFITSSVPQQHTLLFVVFGADPRGK
ncbi:hypothetical protein ABVT39_017929 [Epinephelus coioides]